MSIRILNISTIILQRVLSSLGLIPFNGRIPMNKLSFFIITLALSCIYAILTIKLDIFWRLGECKKANSINEIILNISYSILAAIIFYLFIDRLPYYTRQKNMRHILRIRIDEIKQDISSAKEAIYLPPFTETAITKDGFIHDFEIKNMKDAYCLGIYGFENLIAYFEFNKGKIRKSIHEILYYSEYLTDNEVEKLVKINSSEYINGYFFIKDVDKIKLQPNSFDNQREIGESIYSINELAKEL